MNNPHARINLEAFGDFKRMIMLSTINELCSCNVLS